MDKQPQQDEITALKAIFSEEDYLKLAGEENANHLTSGEFSANFQLPYPFKLQGRNCSRYVYCVLESLTIILQSSLWWLPWFITATL